MTRPDIQVLDIRTTLDHVGFIPYWLNLDDPRPASEQLDAHYGHGGGWRPQSGFTRMGITFKLSYPGDPPLKPLVAMELRDELILIYSYGYVAIFQKDGKFEICRMD